MRNTIIGTNILNLAQPPFYKLLPWRSLNPRIAYDENFLQTQSYQPVAILMLLVTQLVNEAQILPEGTRPNPIIFHVRQSVFISLGLQLPGVTLFYCMWCINCYRVGLYRAIIELGNQNLRLNMFFYWQTTVCCLVRQGHALQPFSGKVTSHHRSSPKVVSYLVPGSNGFTTVVRVVNMLFVPAIS